MLRKEIVKIEIWELGIQYHNLDQSPTLRFDILTLDYFVRYHFIIWTSYEYNQATMAQRCQIKSVSFSQQHCLERVQGRCLRRTFVWFARAHAQHCISIGFFAFLSLFSGAGVQVRMEAPICQLAGPGVPKTPKKSTKLALK